MRTLFVAAVCIALTLPAHARSAHSTLTWTNQGAAVRTSPAHAVQWADRPATHTLGMYHAASAVPSHGASVLRPTHVQRLHTCNPFANVRATQPLAPC